MARSLHNPMIERASISNTSECALGEWPTLDFPRMSALPYVKPAIVDLEVSDDELISISEKGLSTEPGRDEGDTGPLQGREGKRSKEDDRTSSVIPNRCRAGVPGPDMVGALLSQDIHIEIHHVDTTTGEDTTIDSLFKTHIMQPTLDIQEQVDWLLSIFHDNSGVIAWNDDWSLCIKAETHNSPSALDPYGGHNRNRGGQQGYCGNRAGC